MYSAILGLGAGTVLNINLLYSEIPSMPYKIHISYLYSDIEPFKAVNVRQTSLFLIPRQHCQSRDYS